MLNLQDKIVLYITLGAIIMYIYLSIGIQLQQLEQLKLISTELSYIKSDLNGETR